MTCSRMPGFYRLTLEERRRAVGRVAGLNAGELDALDGGGLGPAEADKLVENVLGVYSLPFGVALNVQLNGRDRLVPMVVEEPSVIAAASNAARMVRDGGGFRAQMVDQLTTAQIQLHEVPDCESARLKIEAQALPLLAEASAAVPSLTARGGGPVSLEVRELGDGWLVVHVHLDCCDAMGANLANTVAEALGPRIARLAEGQLGLRIVTNLSDRRCVRAECCVEPKALASDPEQAGAVARAIARASEFAARDPYRAVTHNKGIMNGIDSVVVATGNDYRAVEAGAHAYAARTGSYRPLATWRLDGQRLRGELEVPLAVGTVGGTLKVHPAARLALRIAQVTSAADLAELAACAGLASNLAALRALATEGIQRGHMSLHARSVASAVGALQEEVEIVARKISRQGCVTSEAARTALHALRNG